METSTDQEAVAKWPTDRAQSKHACGLQDVDSKQPILKATGLAVSHADMADLALPCPGHQSHQLIEGHTGDGVSRSARAAEYTRQFVRTWLKWIRPQLCHFSCIQEPVTRALQPSECVHP